MRLNRRTKGVARFLLVDTCNGALYGSTTECLTPNQELLSLHFGALDLRILLITYHFLLLMLLFKLQDLSLHRQLQVTRLQHV